MPQGVTDRPETFDRFIRLLFAAIPTDISQYMRYYQDDIFIANADPEVRRFMMIKYVSTHSHEHGEVQSRANPRDPSFRVNHPKSSAISSLQQEQPLKDIWNIGSSISGPPDYLKQP